MMMMIVMMMRMMVMRIGRDTEKKRSLERLCASGAPDQGELINAS